MKKSFLMLFVLLGLLSVSQAQTKHTIGEKFGGGFVFEISDDGLHGLIAETVDQGECEWLQLSLKLNAPGLHSKSGKVFRDWRLPTLLELRKLYSFKDLIGGFDIRKYYWSSDEYRLHVGWRIFFKDGTNYHEENSYYATAIVRTVRSF